MQDLETAAREVQGAGVRLPVDPLLVDVLVHGYREAGVRHRRATREVMACWREANCYGVLQARRIARAVLAAGSRGCGQALWAQAEEVVLGPGCSVADLVLAHDHARAGSVR